MTTVGGIYQAEGKYYGRPVSCRLTVRPTCFDGQLHRFSDYDEFWAVSDGVQARYAERRHSTPESMVNGFVQTVYGWTPCPSVWRVGELPWYYLPEHG